MGIKKKDGLAMVKKNDICEMAIVGYGSDGAGIGHLEDGRVVFVKGALAFETCKVQILKVGKSALWGRMVEVLSPSTERVDIDCPYYPRCGGCQTRHMTYDEELSMKRSRVEECIRRIGGIPVTVEKIHGAKEPNRYRNKVQFPVGGDKDGVKIGFYRERSHDVIDVGDCLLQPEESSAIRDAVKKWMLEYSVSAYDESQHKGLMRHVYLRFNAKGESLCVLVANGKKLPFEDELVTMLLEAEPKLVGIVLAVNREDTNVVLGKSFRTLWGKDELEDELCGFEFRLSPQSFYQVNRVQTEVLYGRAVDFAGLSGGETVVDLYCGIGTITLAMARTAGKVIGAEIVPSAIENALENATRNGVENVEFILGDAGEAARELEKRGIKPDVVCVDPPRKGLSPDVIESIVRMAPEKVVYVSCDPSTLARDLKIFVEGGYGLREVEACDMFPRTKHVESVALLSQQKPHDYIDVDLAISQLDTTPSLS